MLLSHTVCATLNSGVILPFNHRNENEIWKFERTYNLHTHISISMQMKWSCFCLFIRKLEWSHYPMPAMLAETVCVCGYVGYELHLSCGMPRSGSRLIF